MNLTTHSISNRLKDQNNGHAWLDCESRGLKHRPVPYGDGRTIKVGDHVYVACARCPVVIRKEAI